MNPTTIDFSFPKDWNELSDKQLRFVFSLLARDFATPEILTLCLLRWNKTKVIGRLDDGSFLLKKGRTFFRTTPLAIAETLSLISWLGSLPKSPVRISVIKGKKALPADFSDVPFQTFIICDNLYQGYLSTQNDNLLDQLGAALYGGSIRFKPLERINCFFWFASLKETFARKYSDFFQPLNSSCDDGNLLGSSSPSVEDAMNAQIRALTKGDVTKESLVLALDTHRALTELNAQAREYHELNSKLKS